MTDISIHELNISPMKELNKNQYNNDYESLLQEFNHLKKINDILEERNQVLKDYTEILKERVKDLKQDKSKIIGSLSTEQESERTITITDLENLAFDPSTPTDQANHYQKKLIEIRQMFRDRQLNDVVLRLIDNQVFVDIE